MHYISFSLVELYAELFYASYHPYLVFILFAILPSLHLFTFFYS